MKKSIPELKNLLKLSKGLVVFAVVIKVKFLLSKGHEEKILLKDENVVRITVRLCQIQRGLI